LDARFACIRFQQRGIPPTTLGGPFTVDAHMEDALAVLDGLEIGRAMVVGHSWGGHLALHLAAAFPGRLDGALIVDTLGAVPDGGGAALGERLLARLSVADAARVAKIEERETAGEATEDESKEALGIVWPGYFADPTSAPPMPDMRMSVTCFAETLASIADHFDRRTLERGLPRSTVTAHFLAGRESPIPFFESERSAELMPRATVEIVDDCGHFPWLEQPGSVLAAADRLAATT
jgi:proline iminopeptidase